ncbi:unnamed protein product, partial [marine sediment metagenome]
QIRNTTDIEEVDYLLEIGSIEEDDDILDLFKVIIAKKDWSFGQPVLKALLKKKNPEDIRIGLLNIASGMLMSYYYDDSKYKTIKIMKDSLIKKDITLPNKTNLILSLCEVFNEIQGEIQGT